MKNPSDIALDLVGPIYDAASDPSIWPEVLEKFAEAMDGTGTCFSIYDLRDRPTGSVTTTVRMDCSFQRDYDEHYHSVNLHVLKLPRLFLGLIAVSHTYCSDEEVLRSEYYNDFLRRHDLFHLMGTVVAQEANLFSAVNTYRPLNAQPFGSEEVELLKLLLPHF